MITKKIKVKCQDRGPVYLEEVEAKCFDLLGYEWGVHKSLSLKGKYNLTSVETGLRLPIQANTEWFMVQYGKLYLDCIEIEKLDRKIKENLL